MSNKIIEFPEKYLVGFKAGQTGTNEDSKLAFAVPWGTDSAAKKRIQTMRNWCGDSYYVFNEKTGNNELVESGHVEIEIDNVPTRGFRLNKSVVRWSTSNVLFQIIDPRGFELQVYASNFVEMLLNDTVIGGEFEGEYLWGRHDGKNYLISTMDPLYEESKKVIDSRADWRKPVIGDILKDSQGTESTYIGEVYGAFIYSEYKHSYYSSTTTYEYQFVADRKPWKVTYRRSTYEWPEYLWQKYSRFDVNDCYNLKRKFSDKDAIVGVNGTVAAIPQGEFGSIGSEMRDRDTKYTTRIEMQRYPENMVLFPSLEALDAFIADGGRSKMLKKYFDKMSSYNGKTKIIFIDKDEPSGT